MVERRKRLVKIQFKQEGKGNLNDFDKLYAGIIQKKTNLLSKISNEKLEGLLKTQTKNSVAVELMQTVIPYTMQSGVLVELTSCYMGETKPGQVLTLRGKMSEISNGNAETEDEESTTQAGIQKHSNLILTD